MPPPDSEPVTNRGQPAARALLALVLFGFGLWTLHDFLPALAWAGVFAIAVWPLYRRASRRFPPGRHNVLLPSVFTLGVALLFLVPVALVAVQLGREAHGVFEWIDNARKTGIPPPDWLSRIPLAGPEATTWWHNNLADRAAASELLRRIDERANWLTAGREFGSELLHRIVLFGFTLLTLFFLFREGTRIAAQLRRASQRAFGPSGERVGTQIIASVHGTVTGLVLVGLGEGLLLGIAYAIAGVSQPGLLGLLTAFAAMIPFGAPLLFGVAALLLLAQGAVLAAVAVLVFGMVVSFVADHFIRPALIGGATRLPFLWVLLGILGGIEAWGLLGLFLGPAILAALILLWREFTEGREALQETNR
jgi:predicted PurR-regulated permease PerM